MSYKREPGYETVAVGEPTPEEQLILKNKILLPTQAIKENKSASKDVLLCCYAWLTTLALLLCVILCLFLYYEYVILRPPDVCTSPICVKVSSTMLDKMNRSVDPCDDFYEYACGQWIARTEVPSPFQNWHEIYRLGMDAWETVKKAAVEPSESYSSSQRKAVDLYNSCMDVNKLAELGTAPLEHYLAQVGNWPELNASLGEQNFGKTLISLYKTGFYPIVWVGPAIDDYNTSRYIILVDQPVLSLRSRLYFNASGHIQHHQSSPLLAGLYRLFSFTAQMLGVDERAANETADQVIEFESRMVQIMTPEHLRSDTSRLHNITTLSEMRNVYNFINWTEFLGEIFVNQSIDEHEPMVILDANWLKNLDALIKEYQATAGGRRVLHNYLLWRSVVHLITYLDSELFPPDLRDYLQTVVMSIPNRWIFCITRTMQIATMPLTSIFVDLQPHANDAKQDVHLMANQLLQTLTHEIETLEWMDNHTRATALAKVNRTIALVGFPDFVRNLTELDARYEQVDISVETFADNMLRGMKFLREADIKNLHATPRRESWTVDTSPLKANAYYSFEENRVVIPAAILAPPIYVPGAPRAVNLGSIGTITGHELTHAFDDKGRRYDEFGNIRLWWSRTSAQRYYKKSTCLVDQYSNYTVMVLPQIGPLNIDGNKTRSENLADNGALKLAYMTLMNGASERRSHLYPGLNMTEEQLFFLSYAQTWCAKATPDFPMIQLSRDPHSTEKYRVLGPLHNMPEFAAAFKCPAGSPMNPQRRCTNLW